MRVEIYSDIVCPWCYIGERRFERALAAFSGAADVEVEFRPYQLDPTAPESAVPLREYLAGRFGRNVDGMLEQTGATAKAEGITINWDDARIANTRSAHRLLELAAREYGADTQRALVDRLFALHFTDGGDVSAPDALLNEAVAAGMDRDRTAAYLASDEGWLPLEAEFVRARRLGIRAVPTFVFNGEVAIQGAQSTGTFLRTLEEVAAAAMAGEAGEGDGCEDGACAAPGAA